MAAGYIPRNDAEFLAWMTNFLSVRLYPYTVDPRPDATQIGSGGTYGTHH
jgi:hypothetical protein